MTAQLLLYAFRALVAGGTAERLSPGELDDVAMWIAEACDVDAPALPPHGRECVEVAVAIWAVETGYSWSLYPRATSGCGPMQVLALAPRPRARWATGPCAELRVPRIGLAAGVALYRLKLDKAGGRESLATRWFNGSARAEQYERAVGVVLRVLRGRAQRRRLSAITAQRVCARGGSRRRVPVRARVYIRTRARVDENDDMWRKMEGGGMSKKANGHAPKAVQVTPAEVLIRTLCQQWAAARGSGHIAVGLAKAMLGGACAMAQAFGVRQDDLKAWVDDEGAKVKMEASLLLGLDGKPIRTERPS